MQIKKLRWIKFLLVILVSFASFSCFAQVPTDSLPLDPAISIYTAQNISFGAFYHESAGGSIEVTNTGSRSVTGTVIALNLGISFFQAIFEIEAPPGTIISILNGPDATLNGSNGGSMSLHIGDSDPISPFNTTATPPIRTQINIGGTLTVGNPATNPPGAYNGSFYIIFNQE